jgi:transposase
MLKQEGYKLPERFFQNTNWRNQLERMRVGQTQKIILTGYMKSIESLMLSEAKITQAIIKFESRDIELLESIPGIGQLTSRVIVGAVDEITRFESKKSLAKYGALTPRIYQSGNVTRLGRISRDGRHEIRRVLLQCSHKVARMKSYEARPLKEFFDRIKKRRGKKIAVIALARKLLTIAYGVLKSKKAYDPTLLTGSAA